jgi:hypothetical protein
MEINTLNDAIRVLYQKEEPTLQYEQILDIRNLYSDLAYSAYILHRPESETLRLTFPRECIYVSNIRNNRSCKMVYYKKEGAFIKEVQINANTVIDVAPDTEITVYTRSKPDLIISCIVQLKKAIRSKL